MLKYYNGRKEVWFENFNKQDGGDNIRMDILKDQFENCIDSAQNKDYWKAIVDATLNICAP